MLGGAPGTDIVNVRAQITVFIPPILDCARYCRNLSVDFISRARSREIIGADRIRRQTHYSTLCDRSMKFHDCLSCRTMKLRHPAGDVRTQWSSRKRCASSGLSVAPGWAALDSFSYNRLKPKVVRFDSFGVDRLHGCNELIYHFGRNLAFEKRILAIDGLRLCDDSSESQ